MKSVGFLVSLSRVTCETLKDVCMVVICCLFSPLCCIGAVSGLNKNRFQAKVLVISYYHSNSERNRLFDSRPYFLFIYLFIYLFITIYLRC